MTFNILERKLKNEYLTFIAKVASDEEAVVSALLAEFFFALNRGDAETVKECFAPKAKIQSYMAGGIVGRDAYCDALAKRGWLSVFFDNIFLEVGNSHGGAIGTLTVHFNNGRLWTRDYRFNFSKRQGRWVIAGGKYITISSASDGKNI